MTALYFVLAALALAGAAALLWLDRRRTTGVRRERAAWASGHDLDFRTQGDDLRGRFQRATTDVGADVRIEDVASGMYRGQEVLIFDLAAVATIVAVRRGSSSAVVVDLRDEDALAPAEDDVELLGAMGKRVMFATHLSVARRVCDRRMVALATNAPRYIEVLWNEDEWALGSMPVTNDSERLDTALETVRRFSDLLRVLPPAADQPPARGPHDPLAPVGRPREPRTVASAQRGERPASTPVPSPAPPRRHVRSVDDEVPERPPLRPYQPGHHEREPYQGGDA
ncbi:type III secretion system chaperone family protein [Williamsia sterculiae]|uniref:Secreted protein n=1 Tax=Williamsia sterculiae TaxID=1344003 RepID=A0A1N7CPE6_9NOCA|nr:hypothetical protein [Williamsia sterculiae]SIR65304.1 hypothetical protein SAMN05445060_0262 [Williamsia sterculiae]